VVCRSAGLRSETACRMQRNERGMLRITEWSRRYWEELHSTSAGGAYVNFMKEDEGEGRIRARTAATMTG
jgi:hypothetical protein